MIWAVLASLMWLGILVGEIGYALGGQAIATVIHVYTDEVDEVSFTTADERVCDSLQKWATADPEVKAGDTFEVHYSKMSPCDNVERKHDYLLRFVLFSAAAVLPVVGWVGVRGSLRREGPENRGDGRFRLSCRRGCRP
jgi:hypothetical protein